MIYFEKAYVNYNAATNKYELSIKVKVDTTDIHWENAYIKSIKVSNQENYSDENHWAVVYTDNEDHITEYSHIYTEIDLVPYVTNLGSDMIFIEVLADLNDPEYIECESKLKVRLVTLNTENIYKNYLQRIKNLNACCELPVLFIDYYLNYQGFKLSLANGDYIEAVERYYKMIGNNINSVTSNCRCNG